MICIAYVIFAPFVQRAIVSSRVTSQSANQLDQQRASADRKYQQLLKNVQRTLSYNRAYSTVYQSCYIDHSDAGWTVRNYNYKCQLTYVDFLEHEASATTDKASRLFSYRSESRLIPLNNDTLKADAKDYINDTSTFSSLDLLTSKVVAYAKNQAFANSKLISETGNPTLSTTKGYSILTYTHEYYEQDIGCSITSFIFCNSPLKYSE